VPITVVRPVPLRIMGSRSVVYGGGLGFPRLGSFFTPPALPFVLTIASVLWTGTYSLVADCTNVGKVGDPETRHSGALLYAFVSRDDIVGWGFKGEVQAPN
jgi:hypothetical protein